jgi:hypothetical protein
MNNDWFNMMDKVVNNKPKIITNEDKQITEEKTEVKSKPNINNTNTNSASREFIYNEILNEWDNSFNNKAIVEINDDKFDPEIIWSKYREQLKKQIWGILKYMKTKSHYSISDLLDCPMKSYYLRTGTPPDGNYTPKYPYAVAGQKIGIATHNEIQKTYNFDQCEVKINNKKLGITGRIDAIKGNVIYEIKKSDDLKLYPSFVEQACLYCYLYNIDNPNSIEYFEVILALSNLKNFKTFKFKFDGAAKNMAIYKINMINLINKSLEESNNEKLKSVMDMDKCIFCPYTYTCSKENL